MNGFNTLLLFAAGVAVLLAVALAVVLARRMRSHAVEPEPLPLPARRGVPDVPRTLAPVPPPLPLPPLAATPRREDAARDTAADGNAVQGGTAGWQAWRLMSRALANPGSAGGPLYRLRLEPEETLPWWQPGAVARIYCGPADHVLAVPPRPVALEGDYMVGSLPGDGAVELVVRKVPETGPNGGRRSHWLCEQAAPGSRIALILRDNPGFAPPADTVPLILIGNATGIAGLHAHIKARRPGTRNWLIFGDRNSPDDEALAAEISEWVAIGHLERCDLVLPDEGQRRLVTDQIADARTAILDWTLAGGAIYVCGSELMGDDVHAALSELLGHDVLEAMTEAGRYRRLVY